MDFAALFLHFSSRNEKVVPYRKKLRIPFLSLGWMMVKRIMIASQAIMTR
jgi:hypothetical protein